MKDTLKAIGILCGIFALPAVGSIAIALAISKAVEKVEDKKYEKKLRQLREEEITYILKIIIDHQ